MSLLHRTFNVRGLTDKMYLQRKACNIIFLQECHSVDKTEKKWIAEWGYTAFFSNYQTNSKGVGILFKNS
jgi:exonuclease III